MKRDEEVEAFFKEAENKGKTQYIFTLVRVTGITHSTPDVLLQIRAALSDSRVLSDEEIRLRYGLLIKEELFVLILNLLGCIQGQPYNAFPFQHLYSGRFPNIKKASTLEMLKEVIEQARVAEKENIAKALQDSFPEEVIRWIENGSAPTGAALLDIFQRAKQFIGSLLDTYFAERSKFKERQRLYKLSRFEVLEFLVDDEDGLYGFRLHFSTGTSAEFIRRLDATSCININPSSVPIEFHMGDLDQRRQEWRVGEKRLYEYDSGLPGRYNKFGEWKPLVYPGDSDHLQTEAFKEASDERVRGALFYILCTGHCVMEFAAKSTVELPDQTIVFPGAITLYKCPPFVEGALSENLVIYDGTIQLADVSLDGIRQGLIEVSRAMNRLAFTFNSQIRWCQKYMMDCHIGGVAVPSKEDIELLSKELQSPLSEQALRVLDSAIDWYQRGRNSESAFNAFLCFWIAMEGLALSLVKGELGIQAQYGIMEETQGERETRRKSCIDQYLQVYRSNGNIDIFRTIYFECIESLTRKTKAALEAIFGPASGIIERVFDRKDPVSLSDIRHKLAHGSYAAWTLSDESLVYSRLGEMTEISRAFIMRVALVLKPEEPTPAWSGAHRASFGMADPRSALVVSREDILLTTDWRIRSEWIE